MYQLTCPIRKRKSGNEHIILFFTVNSRLWQWDMFTFCGLKADGMRLLQDHVTCAGSALGVRCFWGSTWIYCIAVINKCSNVGCLSCLSRRVLKMQKILDTNCERNGRTQITGCGICYSKTTFQCSGRNNSEGRVRLIERYWRKSWSSLVCCSRLCITNCLVTLDCVTTQGMVDIYCRQSRPTA
jgi:hypothetical protein